MCSRRENATVVLTEHVSLRTERDPSVLVACERSSLSHEHAFLLAHGERSKCARGSRRENAAVFSMEHVSLRTE